MQYNRVRLQRFFCMIIAIVFILTFLLLNLIFEQTLNTVDRQENSLNDVLYSQTRSDLDSALGTAPELASLLGSNLLVHQFSQRRKLDTSAWHYALYEMLQSLVPYRSIIENNPLLLDFVIYYPNSDTLVNMQSYYWTEAYYSRFYTENDISYESWKKTISSNISGQFISGISTEEILVYVQSIDIGITPDANVMILVNRQELQRMVDDMVGANISFIVSIDGIYIYSSQNSALADVASIENESSTTDDKYGVTWIPSGTLRNVFYYFKDTSTEDEKNFLPVARIFYYKVFLLAVIIVILLPIFAALYWLVKSAQRVKVQKYNAESTNSAMILKTAVNDLFSSKQQDLDDNEWWIVKDVLLDLLTYSANSQDDVLNTLSDHDIIFQYPYFLVTLFQFSDPVPSAVFAMVSSIIADSAQDQIACAGFPIGQRKFVVLLNLADSSVVYQDVVEQIQHILQQEIKANITAFIGSIQNGADNIYHSYKDANALVDYTVFTGTNAILDHNVFLHSSAEYYYPMNVELNLITAVYDGNEPRVLNILKDIHDKNFVERQLRPDMAKIMLNELAGTTLKITQDVGAELVENSAARVLQCNTVDDIFYTLQEIYVDACRRQRTLAADSRRDQFKQYILLHYTDPNFSQSSMAADLKLTQNYLSSQFKAYFGVTMISYINSLRADHAAMLLKETDSTIQDIAVLCGFSTSDALNRVFKQKYGITPGNYRSSFRRSSGHNDMQK